MKRWHALLLVALWLPATAAAHGFGRLYNLPVPFWLYGWGSACALLLSFLLLAALSRTSPQAVPASRALGDSPWLQRLRPALTVLKAMSLGLLLLCIVTGWVGNRDPYKNFNMTFFWVIGLLAVPYLTALIGNFYSVLNPWRLLVQLLARIFPRYGQGRYRWPAWLGEWPALILFLGLIWIELFHFNTPRSLSVMLLIYTGINLIAVGLFGSRTWFQHGECLAVFLRHIGRLAPLDWQPDAADPAQRLRLRKPGAGLLDTAPQLSSLAFVLAMLSTTAFDGLRATQSWVWIFWRDPTGLLREWAGAHPIYAAAIVRPWYIAWESSWLIASPFLYLGLVWLCTALARTLTRHRERTLALALAFAYSLLPIAFVYHLTHYSTLLLTQGLKIVSLASDPFGWGWNLFGTAMLWKAPILPDMSWVWHGQVGLILAGHIASVVAAHRVALRVFGTARAAVLSQVPMLLLMMALTVSGLWILAQPLVSERMM